MPIAIHVTRRDVVLLGLTMLAGSEQCRSAHAEEVVVAPPPGAARQGCLLNEDDRPLLLQEGDVLVLEAA